MSLNFEGLANKRLEKKQCYQLFVDILMSFCCWLSSFFQKLISNKLINKKNNNNYKIIHNFILGFTQNWSAN